MVRGNKRTVIIAVSPNWYDKIFEVERKKLERKYRTTFSQRTFTEFLAKRRATFKFPKQSNAFLLNGIKKTKIKRKK